MKNKNLLIIIATAVVCAFVNFYSTNLLCSDLSNMFYGVHDAYIVSSVPLFTISLDILVFLIFFVRYVKNKNLLKSMGKLYSVFLIVNSLIGTVFALLTGTVIYHNFFAPYPFAGYTIITLLVSLALLALGIYLLVKSCKLPDGEKKKITLWYVIHNVVVGLGLYYTMYTLGSFIWSPVYLHWRTLYMTFVFYLSMLCPIAIATNAVLHFEGFFNGKEKLATVVSTVIAVCSLVLSAGVLIIGATNSQFISAISPALPIERLATLPAMSILHFVVTVVFSLHFLLLSLRKRKQAKKAN